MHKAFILAAVLIVGAGSAVAQQAPAKPATKPVSDVSRDWAMLNGAMEHAAASISTLVKENTDLQAEREVFKGERDALKSERDALKVERDALKAEVEKLKKP